MAGFGGDDGRGTARGRWLGAFAAAGVLLLTGLAWHGGADVAPPVPAATDVATAALRARDAAMRSEDAGERSRDVAIARTAAPAPQPAPALTEGGVVAVTVRVRGPSPALLPHLEIAVAPAAWRESRTLPADAPRQRPGPDGRATFRVPPQRARLLLCGERCQVALGAADGSGFVFALQDGATFEVEPWKPLAGVIVREAGSPVRSAVVLGEPGTSPFLACHVFARTGLEAASAIAFLTAAGHQEWRCCTRDAWRFDGDLVFVDAAAGLAFARLAIHAEVPEALRNDLVVTVERLPDGTPVRRGKAGELLPGRYRVRWTVSGTPGPVIEPELVLAPGESRELLAVLPVVEEWTCRVVDSHLLGDPTGTLCVRVGMQWARGCTNGDGVVPILLAAPPRVGDEALLWSPARKLDLPARVRAVDAANRTFELCLENDVLGIVRLRSIGLGAGTRQIVLAPATTLWPRPAWLWSVAAIPLAAGTSRNGAVTEIIDDRRQVTRWFTVRAGTPELLLEPQGRFATVRVERAVLRATVLLEGHADLPPLEVGELHEPGVLRVFVPDGTRAVHVDLVPGGRVTFAPELAGFVVR